MFPSDFPIPVTVDISKISSVFRSEIEYPNFSRIEKDATLTELPVSGNKGTPRTELYFDFSPPVRHGNLFI